MSRDEELTTMTGLLRQERWGALATLEEDGTPYASAVAYVIERDFSGLLLHLSSLAPHTRNLTRHSAVSLMVSERDTGEGDPQTLARVSVLGHAVPLLRGSTEYEAARGVYLERLPSATPLFDFPDFQLYRLAIREARFVGGFARARRVDARALAAAAD